DDERERSRRALEIWNTARDLRGTPASKYLERRGVDLAELPDPIAEALRWHSRCPWEGSTRACLIGLWTDSITGEPRAIHRRPISPEGDKLDHWRALGPTAGCVIRLWPDDAVELGLVLGEGIETCLVAATQIEHKGALLQPIWAAGDAGHLAVFPVLAG